MYNIFNEPVADIVKDMIPPVDPLDSPPLVETLSKQMGTIMKASVDVLTGAKAESDYRLERLKKMDSLHGSAQMPAESGIYTTQLIIKTFTDVSADPKLFNATNIDTLNPVEFNMRMENKLVNSEYFLNEIRISPTLRLVGQFHIRNIRTLKDALLARVYNHNNAVVCRDTMVTYAAEMEFLHKQADGIIVDFINKLV